MERKKGGGPRAERPNTRAEEDGGPGIRKGRTIKRKTLRIAETSDEISVRKVSIEMAGRGQVEGYALARVRRAVEEQIARIR